MQPDELGCLLDPEVIATLKVTDITIASSGFLVVPALLWAVRSLDVTATLSTNL